MAGPQEAGVKFTADIGQFLADITKASDALQQFGETAVKLSGTTLAIFDKLPEDVNELSRAFTGLVQSGQLTEKQLAGISDRINELMAGGFDNAEAMRIALAETLGPMYDAAKAAAELAAAEDKANSSTQKFIESLAGVSTELLALGTAGVTAAIGAATTASRIEELEIILDVTRKNAIAMAEAEYDFTRASELNYQAVQQQVEGIRDLHLAGTVANETVAQLIRYGLDWTKATELAALAQNSAVFAMQDSTQALQGLIRGITTLQTRQLRTYGIMINLNDAYAAFARANNIATSSMTESQKQQAALNAVLAQAPAVAGAYTASMETASKQLRSLKTDAINLGEAFGEELTPVLDLGVSAFRGLLRILTDLPDPLQAFVVYAGGSASALSLLAGTAGKLLPRLLGLKQGFTALAAAMGLSNVALLGAGGLIAALAGIIGVIASVEKAHQDEARSIFEVSTSYVNYIGNMERAEIGSYALSAGLYEIAKAAQEAGKSIDAIELRGAQRETDELVKEIFRLTEEWKRNSAGMEINVTEAEFLDERLTELVGRMDELQLLAVQDTVSLVVLGQEMGLSASAALELAQRIQDLALAERLYRDIREQTRESDWDAWRQAAEGATQYEDVLRENINWTDILNQREKARYDNLVKMHQAEMEFAQTVSDAVEDSAWKQIEAWDARTRAFEELDRDYANKSGDLWQEYQDALAEVDQDIAAFHRGTLDELLDLDREYAQKREDAYLDYLQAIEDAERELAQDLEDLASERVQKLEDLEREYAQDREDIMRDLARDLEDIERDHLDTMRELEEDYYADLAALAEEYGDKLSSITEKYANERQEIEEKYSLEPPEPDYDAQREELQKLLKELIAAYEAGDISGYLYRQRREEIEAQLDALKAEELAALEERKQEELAALEEWLAEEEAARERAYQEARAEEERRFQERKSDRERETQQRLDDLQRQNQQERDEIERDYQRRLADLQLQHQREREEIDRNNQRKLEDMNTQYAREKALILEKLEDQRVVAKEKYAEGLKDLNKWYDDQKETINQKYEEQLKDIERNLQMIVLKASEEFGKMPAAFQPVWDELIRQGQEQAANFVDGIIAEFQRMFDFFEMHSPSKLMERFAHGVVSPLENIWGDFNAADLLGDSLGATSMQANIDAALGKLDLSGVLPAQRAIVPSGGSVSNSRTVNNNFNVTAQYRRYQSEGSLRNDLELLRMDMGG